MQNEDLINKIYAWHKSKNAGDVHREHLGASIIGEECPRKLFYSFRWAGDLSFSGRMFRLFDRGRREEPVFIEELKAVGFDVEPFDQDGEQFRFKEFGGHFAGSADGIVTRPDGLRQLVEFKTSGKTQFNALVKHGIQKHKPQHYAQIQVYLHYLKLPSALYVVVCKDSDRLHIITVDYDPMIADEMKGKARDIIFSSSPPRKISQDPAFYQCKMCHYAGQCHGTQPMKQSCRTCSSARPLVTSGGWFCDRYQAELSKEHQIASCDQYQELT